MWQRTVLEPLDGLDIQMVGRLIEEEEVDLHQHGAAEGDAGGIAANQYSSRTEGCTLEQNSPHLPSSGKRVDGNILPLGIEAELEEGVADLLLVGLDPGLVKHELADGNAALVTLDVVLDVSGLKVLGEVVDLLAVDGFEKGRLSTSVGSAHSVAVTTAELEGGVVEEEESSVGERERKVANDLSLLVIIVGGVDEVASL